MIYNATEETTISIEDAALIKRLVGMGYPPLIVGQVFEALEDMAAGSSMRPH